MFTTNLLSSGGSSGSKLEYGVYVGEALPPVPKRLVERLQAWEFMEMLELLPKFWAQRAEDKEGSQKAGANRRKRLVTKLNAWLQMLHSVRGGVIGKPPRGCSGTAGLYGGYYLDV